MQSSLKPDKADAPVPAHLYGLDCAFLSSPLMLDVSSLKLTDRQLEKLFADNGDLQFEVTAKGELVIMAPTGSLGGRLEGKLFARLDAWAEIDGTGLAFGPSSGFRLPNGSLKAPDVSWIQNDRWNALSEDEQKSFAPLCPDFALELRSPGDTLVSVQRKMQEYLENGARLGWLIDPINKQIHIYRPGVAVAILDEPETVSGDPVLPGFVLELQEIW